MIIVPAFVGEVISVSLSFFFFLLDLGLFLLESMMVWPLWRVATYSFWKLGALVWFSLLFVKRVQGLLA